MTLAHRLSAAFLLATLTTATLPGQTRDGVDILLGKARSLEARGRIDLAAQNWSQVLLVDPNQTEALAGLARHAKQNGDANNLRLYLERLRKLKPNDPAVAAIERMRVLTPQERARLDEAGRLAARQRPDEAMKIYREVFGNEPPWGKWTEPFYDTLAASTGGREEAIARLRQLSSRDPGNQVYALWLARILSYEPKTRMEALRLFEGLRDSGTVEQARTVWRQGLVWEKDNPAALASIEAYVQRYPDRELQDALSHLKENKARAIEGADRERGFQALRSKDVTTAQQKFEDVLRRSPADVNALAGLGFVRLEQKRFQDAVTLFDKARQLAPQRTDIREGYETSQYWSAMERGTYMQARDPDAAIAAYQSALAIRPQETGPALAIAQVMLTKKNLAEAGGRFQRILKQSPDNADATMGLGFVRLNEKSFDEAARLLERARALGMKDNADVEEGYRTARFWGLTTKAAAALEENRLDAAMSGFEDALTINPTSKDALLGLAGAAERGRKEAVAISAYERLTSVAPNDASVWLGLVRIQVTAGHHADALETSRRAPSSVRETLDKRPDHLARLSLALLGTKRQSEAEQMMRRALDAASEADTKEALNARLEMAGELTKAGNTDLAISIYRQATDNHPELVDAWQGLLGAYTSTRDFTRAMAAIRAMPRNVYEAAAKNSGFLNTVAAVYAADGRCTDAEGLLTASIDLDKAAGRSPTAGTQLQLADIWMRQGRYDKAGPAYRTVVSVDAQSVDAWRGYLTALHYQGNDGSVLTESRRIPEATRALLGNEAGFLTLLASANATAGQHDEAVALLEHARARYRTQRQPVPADLDLQLGWAMLSSSRSASLGDLIAEMRQRTDLSQAQRTTIDEMWSTWTMRRADAALKAGDEKRASAILTDAWGQMPQDPRIPSALAAMHVQQDHQSEALDVYRMWGMQGATAGDYRAAAGAALATHDRALADRFLQEGLQRFPGDRELLHMTARQAASQGSYKDAERLLKAALAAPPEKARAGQSASASQSLTLPASSGPACRQNVARGVPESPRLQLISLRPLGGIPLPRGPVTVYDVAHSPQDAAPPPSGADQPRDQQAADRIQDDIDTVTNRNTPVVSGAFSVMGRSGDPGINRLVVSEHSPGGSAAVANKVRFGIDVHGVSLNTGTPDGNSESRFGTLAPGVRFTEQKADGYGGEVQLSMDRFGLAVGTTPTGFPVSTWTAGLRIGSTEGPVRFVAFREPIKDSMLSYAGMRDPGTGAVWGGVVANAASVQISHDNSGTGQYLAVGGGLLRGQNVEDNWNVDASAGLYWSLAPIDQGQLTLGMNATAMHYARNLSFFSFGQGGYFSPQRFLQASVPLSWSARHGRVAYELQASPGWQYFTEDASPYFPLGTTVTTDPFDPLVYAAHDHQGPAYNVGLRTNVRVASHWHLGFFAAANNTRDFNSVMAGVSIKLLARPLPTSSDLRVNSIPDWRGQRPFGF